MRDDCNLHWVKKWLFLPYFFVFASLLPFLTIPDELQYDIERPQAHASSVYYADDDEDL